MDVQKVRAKFPALDKEQVFFDNAGGSQVLGSVVDSYVRLVFDCREKLLIIKSTQDTRLPRQLECPARGDLQGRQESQRSAYSVI